ncbi:glycoside hydrolase family 32 protein [Paraflavitalea pollutisoli]|uniref:glycoside hydrolase family 32 protein n=1 Tax=Paraflavitalea pollutisoli TaxID=3034143 RepID=UPI0023ED8AA7|nr:glycoside hydrolase family 32 protein [Paraflavitalea sp. H1-2-19X]
MRPYKCILAAIITLYLGLSASAQPRPPYQLPYRPQLHFTPKAHWINDPNGMVFYKGTYHLFFQYYPDGTVWGPMHWGHATSKDLVQWQEQPIALYPDSLGYIFSGSAVIDEQNTSGFGKPGNPAMVAIFTHHDPVEEKKGKGLHEYQSLAYSLDEGKTWTKYAGNPVIRNPGIPDFRDPKVMWHESSHRWIMTLATKDRITFYSSPNLKDWTRESEFGAAVGAHGGVWECPDLFTLEHEGNQKWVLIVNINPGGPNGGSATQYFVGGFDGHTFTADDQATRWLDYGPDEYAGITWSNTGKRRIFLGWMSNWDYADRVPTGTWRGAMTIPRELGLVRTGEGYRVISQPVAELMKSGRMLVRQRDIAKKDYQLVRPGILREPYALSVNSAGKQDFSIRLSNPAGEELLVGYDKKSNEYYIDRSRAGKSDFVKNFARRHVAPRMAQGGVINLTLVVDVASVELFADGGLTTMTSTFFPTSLLGQVQVSSPAPWKADIQVTGFKSIWK